VPNTSDCHHSRAGAKGEFHHELVSLQEIDKPIINSVSGHIRQARCLMHPDVVLPEAEMKGEFATSLHLLRLVEKPVATKVANVLRCHLSSRRGERGIFGRLAALIAR
jgi:hypothetical protein